jgi:hypothetical protein
MIWDFLPESVRIHEQFKLEDSTNQNKMPIDISLAHAQSTLVQPMKLDRIRKIDLTKSQIIDYDRFVCEYGLGATLSKDATRIHIPKAISMYI